MKYTKEEILIEIKRLENLRVNYRAKEVHHLNKAKTFQIQIDELTARILKLEFKDYKTII